MLWSDRGDAWQWRHCPSWVAAARREEGRQEQGQAAVTASGQDKGCGLLSHGSTRVSLFLSLFLPIARDAYGGSSLVAGEVPTWPWTFCQTVPRFPHAAEQ